MTKGFVLHKRPYRDSSALIELLTDTDGIVPVVAHGVKRAKSKLASVTQQFCLLEVSYTPKGELRTLKQAEMERHLFLSGEQLLCGFYMNELILKLIPRLSHCEDVFELYENTLQTLSSCDSIETLLRRFEKQLLELLGYGISFSHTLSGQSIEAKQFYALSLDQGFEIATEQDGLPGHTLLKIDQEKLDTPDTLQAAKHIMRRLIQAHLGHKTIESRSLFR
ncbi:MAG: DNA repair protein RecO [Gammaproteobacteria bacterium CG11_big_fil_rev_8_21_14_0_20_46_22]|nr:MAG: DNA repair protein RecO [Gammaproteobacteria bacterium CG12_big_fil_rev_8_21_14_0_65_46_12]PIR11690.1 MAG: DNA repair protein RecO [Gammaproteobacteria bacterium CG11_big_fil_rev_8_21_14_0_20_46_22]